MSNIISPFASIDFGSTEAELSVFITDTSYIYTNENWTVTLIIPDQVASLPNLSSLLSAEGLSVSTVDYVEVSSGSESYSRTVPYDSIIIPVQDAGSTISSYSLAEGAQKDPSKYNSYFASDCTLLDTLPLTGCVAVKKNQVTKLTVPEGEVFKAYVILVNEDITV